MSVTYKKGDKVLVIATSYIPGTYQNHSDFSCTIHSVCEVNSWKSEYVPEYEVRYKGNYITIPEYSISGKKR